MKRRIELEFRDCISCPYCRLTKRIEDSRGDLWMCYHDHLALREVIEDKAMREFKGQYPNLFPSWCPLPIVEDDVVVEEAPHQERDGRKHKWTLKDPERYDLSRAVIYLADDGRHWRLFAARTSTKRATNSSYEDYNSFEDVIERFGQDHGSGSEWEQQPLKVSARKRVM